MNKWLIGGITASVAFVTFLFLRKGKAPKLPECDDSLKAVHFGSVRDTNKIRLIVIHSTEGDTAAGAAGWFTNPASGGSTHYVVDNNKCFNTLPDNVIPWGARGGRANEDGLHIELAGYAKWTRDEWLNNHFEELKNAAAIVRMWSDKYGIPVELLSVDDLKSQGNSARGITTHANITKAFGVDTHTDPGSGFPMDVFLDLVRG